MTNPVCPRCDEGPDKCNCDDYLTKVRSYLSLAGNVADGVSDKDLAYFVIWAQRKNIYQLTHEDIDKPCSGLEAFIGFCSGLRYARDIDTNSSEPRSI